MCTVTLSYDGNNALAQQQLTAAKQNRVYIDNGEVKMELHSDTMSIEEAKNLTLKMVELEYSLP